MQKKTTQCGLKNGKHVQKLINQGLAWFEGEELVAVASDKVKVSLGVIWTQKDLDTVEKYLDAHPTPDTW